MDWDEAGVLRLEISQNKIHHIQAASFSIPLQYSMNRFCVCMHFNFEMGLKLQEHWISSQNPAAPQSISSVTSPPNSTLRQFPSYLLLTLPLYFIFIYYLTRCILPDSPSISSQASLPLLSCCHCKKNSLKIDHFGETSTGSVKL